jgi:hypothetical protein
MFLAPVLAAAQEFTLIGNGSLTVALDDAGRLLGCRWPTPGTPDYAPLCADDVCGWGLRAAGETSVRWGSAPGAPWRVEPTPSPHPGAWETTLRAPEGDEALHVQLIVHPVRDLIAVRATVSGMAASAEVLWHAAPLSVTRPVTGLPGLAERRAARRDKATGPWRTSAALAYRTLVARAVPDADVQRAEFFIAFGHADEDLVARLEEAGRSGFARLAEETQAYWQARAASLPVSLQPMPAALRTLILATDRGGGAVVDAAAGEPAWGVVSGRTSAWAAAAYDAIGDSAAASRALHFLARAVIHQARPGIPAGLLPSRLYTDGRPAAPYAVRDLDGLCWFLGACARHAAHLTGPERTAFLEGVEGAIDAGADLIADWTLGPNGPPLPSYQEALGSDGESMATLLLMLSGLHAASEARLLKGDTPNPDWESRFDALLARVLLGRQEGAPPRALDPVLAYWLRTGIAAGNTPRLAGLRALPVEIGGVVLRLEESPCPAAVALEMGGAASVQAAALALACGQAPG